MDRSGAARRRGGSSPSLQRDAALCSAQGLGRRRRAFACGGSIKRLVRAASTGEQRTCMCRRQGEQRHAASPNFEQLHGYASVGRASAAVRSAFSARVTCPLSMRASPRPSHAREGSSSGLESEQRREQGEQGAARAGSSERRKQRKQGARRQQGACRQQQGARRQQLEREHKCAASPGLEPLRSSPR